jgi:anti-sigma B factor antagonist
MMRESGLLAKELARFSERHDELRLSLGECLAPPALVLSAGGVLDTDNTQDFSAVSALALAEAAPSGGLILDLGGLSYISSTGVGAIMNLLSASRELKTMLYLRGMKPQVKALFDALGFNAFFVILNPEGGEA